MKNPLSSLKEHLEQQYLETDMTEERFDSTMSCIDDLVDRKPPSIEELKAINEKYLASVEQMKALLSHDKTIKPTHFSGKIH